MRPFDRGSSRDPEASGLRERMRMGMRMNVGSVSKSRGFGTARFDFAQRIASALLRDRMGMRMRMVPRPRDKTSGPWASTEFDELTPRAQPPVPLIITNWLFPLIPFHSPINNLLFIILINTWLFPLISFPYPINNL